MVYYESKNNPSGNERVPMPSFEKLKALEILVEEGQADRPAIFELFTRNIDPTYSSFVVAGVTQTVEQLLRYSYTKTQIEHMSEFVSLKTVDYLSDYRYKGSLFGLKEGSLAFPFTPVLTGNCTIGEGVIASTLLESLMTEQMNTATACAHITKNIGSVPVVDNFSASNHYAEGSDETARTAYMTGFAATTNLKGSLSHRIPVYDVGTRKHFVVFADERTSYEITHNHFKSEATYLINTDDISGSIETAAHASEGQIHAVRVETKHYLTVVPAVREHLDIIGAENTRIVLSGNFNTDDAVLMREANLPIDVLICNQNPADLVNRTSVFNFEAVAVEQDGNYVPVSNSGDEDSIIFGGVKTPYREFNDDWEIETEKLIPTDSLRDLMGADLEALQEAYIKKGSLNLLPSLKDSRELYRDMSSRRISSDMKVKIDETIIWES